LTDASPRRSASAVLRWRLRSLWRTARFLPGDVWDTIRGRRDPLVPPRRLMFMGGREYRAVGDALLRQFVAHAGLMPDHDVLDVGCGIGRAAVPLAEYIADTGSYDGFDIVSEGIAWCDANITSRRANFRFRHADVFNSVYNPTGALRAETYRFPYPDASFDFAFATSVFTHMLPDQIRNYTCEMERVLRPGGKVFATFFLLTPASRDAIAAEACTIPLRHRDETSMSTSDAAPEQAIAFDEAVIRAVFDAARLQVTEPVRYGVWAGGDTADSFQDIVVARKPGVRADSRS
jgi:ubiquinone/menaquinone biosynthesis C-methylase UbiE